MKLIKKLEINRCPHCNIAQPNIPLQYGPIESVSHSGNNFHLWALYRCDYCGSLILASTPNNTDKEIDKIYPSNTQIDESIPERVKAYLLQAIESIHAPSGAVILAASAVDAMLKNKNLKEGSLYSRIDEAANNHLITPDMAKWAHDIRLEANEQRHSDEDIPLPNETDAKRVVEFSLALAQLLFVLPARVQRGLEEINNEWKC